MKKLHDSNMEIFIEIGSNSQKIPFYLRLDEYSFFTSCSEANIDKNLIKPILPIPYFFVSVLNVKESPLLTLLKTSSAT